MLLSQSLQHELWVRAEPAALLVHRLAPQVESGDKRVLLTVAWLDKQVSNGGQRDPGAQPRPAEPRGLGLEDLVGIPDVAGPADAAMVVYDTGTYDI